MMKKRIFSALALLGAVATLAVGCQKEELTGIENNEGTVLYAAAPGSAQSKIEFTEGEESGIDLAWEVGDMITLYQKTGANTTDRYANMNCESVDDGVATFKLIPNDENKTLGNGDYTAVYPAAGEEFTFLSSARNRDLTKEQDGDEMDNLNDACYMEAEFAVDGDAAPAVNFSHKKAMMTFTFPEVADKTPAKLVFKNGDEKTYTVNFPTALAATGGVYTAYIMIDPCEDAEPRTLTFSLYNTDDTDTPYDVRSINTEVAYSAGTRYNAPVSTIPVADGTAEYPFLISSATDLRKLSLDVAGDQTKEVAGNSFEGKYFKMTQRIDLEKTAFTPIGSESAPFKGNFDGDNFEVSNLSIDNTEANNQGLFGYVSGASITNLTVFGGVTGKLNVGGVVGYATAAVINNCTNQVTVDGTQYVGGVAGKIEDASLVINCSNRGSVGNAATTDVGGVVGIAKSQKVVNCYNVGSVSGSTMVGGITSQSWCIACYNTKEIGEGRFFGGIRVWGSSSYCYSPKDYDGDETFYLADMSDQAFVVALNNGAYNYNNPKTDPPVYKACAWKDNRSSFPLLDLGNAPTYTEVE